MSERPPAKDWATDFDHLDPRWINDPFPIWDDLRHRCPIAHTDRFQGVYLPTRYADVRAVAYDTEHFWHGFFLRHPMLAAAAVLKRLSRRSPAPAPSSGVPESDAPSWSDAGARIAKILFVGVDAEHRSRGLAARLYGDIMLRLARRGVTRVDARIGATNTASLRLHERTGWTLRPDDGVVFATRSLR